MKLCCQGLIFFKMAAIAMDMAKMLKELRTQK
jgi:hypothetical protein